MKMISEEMMHSSKKNIFDSIYNGFLKERDSFIYFTIYPFNMYNTNFEKIHYL